MAEETTQPQQVPQDTGGGQVVRPPADPDLSDHYERAPSSNMIEKRQGERINVMADNDQKPPKPDRPAPDPDLSDPRQLEDKPPIIVEKPDTIKKD